LLGVFYFWGVRSFLKALPLEALTWTLGLVLLAMWPVPEEAHFTVCPLYHLGFSWCPGCGLGRSVSLFFHGEAMRSLRAHPLGIFAVIILSFRIFQLTKHYLTTYGKSH
jgi:hypothetical protein